MNRSLQSTLSVTLAGALVLAALVAASVSFWLAYGEATETQDDLLRQVAGVSAVVAQPPGMDPDARLIVLHFPRDARPAWLPPALEAGMHTLATPAGPVRACLSRAPSGEQTLAAQSTALTDELALDSALRILIPFLLLIPVQLLLIVRIVRAGVAPLHRLALQLDGQSAGQATAIAATGLPAEVAPFIAAINGLIVRVGDMLQQQRRFIADAAHELRTPLTALHLQAQNLAHAESIEAMHARLQPLQDGVARARRLAEQMLSLAGVEAGAQPVSSVDLQAVVRELVVVFLPLGGAYRIDLGFGRSAPVCITGNPDHVRQIVRNAIENAINYSPPGGQVSIDIYTEAGCAVIDVSDDGPGIPVADRARVFDAFVRLPDAAGFGSGIGLAIAREAAHRLGGAVSLHGRPGRAGLLFRYRQTLQPAPGTFP